MGSNWFRCRTSSFYSSNTIFEDDGTRSYRTPEGTYVDNNFRKDIVNGDIIVHGAFESMEEAFDLRDRVLKGETIKLEDTNENIQRIFKDLGIPEKHLNLFIDQQFENNQMMRFYKYYDKNGTPNHRLNIKGIEFNESNDLSESISDNLNPKEFEFESNGTNNPVINIGETNGADNITVTNEPNISVTGTNDNTKIEVENKDITGEETQQDERKSIIEMYEKEFEGYTPDDKLLDRYEDTPEGNDKLRKAIEELINDPSRKSDLYTIYHGKRIK